MDTGTHARVAELWTPLFAYPIINTVRVVKTNHGDVTTIILSIAGIHGLRYILFGAYEDENGKLVQCILIWNPRAQKGSDKLITITKLTTQSLFTAREVDSFNEAADRQQALHIITELFFRRNVNIEAIKLLIGNIETLRKSGGTFVLYPEE